LKAKEACMDKQLFCEDEVCSKCDYYGHNSQNCKYFYMKERSLEIDNEIKLRSLKYNNDVNYGSILNIKEEDALVIDVPADGSCLFIALAYFLNDNILNNLM
jgi:hypothetical protein